VDYNKANLYCRLPNEYGSGFIQGSNDKIFFDIVEELNENSDQIKEIQLTLFLFNNMELYNNLLKLAEKGINITIISLPIQGYKKGKREKAKKLYTKILTDNKIKLLIYPHMYVWYTVGYGGFAPYSFHIKAGQIIYKTNESKIFLTSANVASGDPTHSEIALFLKCDKNSKAAEIYQNFFSEICERAVCFETYKQIIAKLPAGLEQIYDFLYVGCLRMKNLDAAQHNKIFFTAPFLTYNGIGSNHYARQKIIEVIKSAQKRLLFCAQHSHDIDPYDNYNGETIIKALTTITKENPDIEVCFLKQTDSSGLTSKGRASYAEEYLHRAKIPQKANKLLHDKFIVADDTVLFTTGNFTATQFTWGEIYMEHYTSKIGLGDAQTIIDNACEYFNIPNVRLEANPMEASEGNQKKIEIRKLDVFSEVNAFIIIDNKEIADNVENYFKKLWNHKLSKEVKIPI